jgi:hypothetical protein
LHTVCLWIFLFFRAVKRACFTRRKKQRQKLIGRGKNGSSNFNFVTV